MKEETNLNKLTEDTIIPTNKYQTPITKQLLEKYPQEVQEQFLNFVRNVPYIKNLISPTRPHAKDCKRDENGRIIVDLTNPILHDDMDYFRPTAINYQKYGKINNLRPNPNPNSEYGKWIREEIRRCYYGYTRKSDGDFVTGDMYFFLNYCPILLSKIVDKKKALRVWDFPEYWEGHNLKFNYIEQARNHGHHGAELASRSKGKSFSLAAMTAKRFILGESPEVNREVKCLITAYQKEYLTKDGILNKFQSYIDFCAQNTEFPSRRIKSSLNEMAWKMGYVDLDTNTQKGTLNEVLGVSSKDDESKLRGKRGVLIGIEEFGSFPNLLGLYGTLRPSVEEGDVTYGLIWAQGTAGDDTSDFAAAQEIMYNPIGYNMEPIPNVYDIEGQGRKFFTYFFPGYINRKGCYDKDGNSDVVKALLEILMNRYMVKYNSTDINAITKTISETPITPQEAILRTKGNIFPVTELNNRLNEIDNNPSFYDQTYVGDLELNNKGEVEFVSTNDKPIREFPLKDNKAHPYDTKVYTPQGQKLWKDIKVGDELIGTNGKPTKVLNIPFDDITDVYEITLKDGRKVQASGNHKWNIIDTNGYNKILSTKYMYDNGWYRVGKKYIKQGYRNLKYFIPKNCGADYSKKDLPIMPYFLGLMLGDGCICRSSMNRAKFTSSIQDMNVYKTLFPYDVNTIDDRHHYIIVKNIKKAFTFLGLENTRSNTKFIPEIYKYSSREDRLELLRGLCDTDGTIDYGGNVSYTTVSKKLCLDIIELARSLGINCNVTNDYITSNGSHAYCILFYSNERLFNLPRKYQKQKITKNRYKKTGIYDIRYIGKKKCKCVTVDAIDHCYLVEDYITTHNCKGAIEIFEMPIKVKDKVPNERYILSLDNIENDQAQSMSLGSILVLDLWTDRIVAEYTGRPMFADDLNEIARKMCIFYNGKIMVENNKKNTFAYFSRMNSLHLMADCPEYLKQKQIIKYSTFGNSSKGITGTPAIFNFAYTLIRDWLLKPVTIVKEEGGETIEYTVPNLHFINNRALIKECILFNPDINVDRLKSLCQLMLYREEKMIIYQNNISNAQQRDDLNDLSNDPFFKDNYDNKESVWV